MLGYLDRPPPVPHKLNKQKKKSALIGYNSSLYNILHHTATFGSINKAHTETCIIVTMLENVKYTKLVCRFTWMQTVIHK
jgi:hypothetical protein